MKKRFISCFYCIFSNVSHSFFHKFRRSPRNSYLWQADDYQMRNLRHGYRKTKTACCTLPSRSAGRGRTQAGEERWRTKGAGGRRALADEGCRSAKTCPGHVLSLRQTYSLPCREMLRQEKHPRYPEMIRLLVYGKCAVVAFRNISGGLHADSLPSVLC